MRIVIFVLLLFMQMSVAGEVTFSTEKLASESYSLTPAQELELSKKAMFGDADAGLRIADRYFYDHSSGREAELRELALKWAVIAAENGSPKAQFRAFQLMHGDPNPLTQARALFWLKRSAGNNFEDARINLAECLTLDTRRPSGTRCYGPDRQK